MYMQHPSWDGFAHQRTASIIIRNFGLVYLLSVFSYIHSLCKTLVPGELDDQHYETTSLPAANRILNRQESILGWCRLDSGTAEWQWATGHLSS